MNSLFVETLRSFNSKERYFLVGQILGNPTFKPSTRFLEKLSSVLKVKIPNNVFSAMDYHLDWIYASLQISSDNGQEKIYFNKNQVIKAQQEDIDYLIAYDSEGISNIILIEAKGVTGWTNTQMKSKAERLSIFFGQDGRKWEGVIPHFVIISPNEPQKLDSSSWPDWMAKSGDIPWLKLEIPSQLKKISRCNIKGKADKNGEYWTVLVR